MRAKFIHVTDMHIMARTPKYRKDDFLATMIEKLKWVQEYAENIGASAILCTGDFFDRPDTAYSALNEIMGVLSSSKVRWISIIGNHDEFGYNPKTIGRTPLGSLFMSGAIDYVNYHNPIIIREADEAVLITGCDSTIETDNREDKWVDYGMRPNIDLGAVNIVKHIHLSHGFLANKDWGDMIHHTRISEIADKVDADVVLCGHEHSGFGVVESNGKLFVNGGALARVTSGVGDIGRDVKVAEITVDGNTVDVKLVKVGVSKDADEVIDIEQAQQERNRTRTLENFTESIRNVETLQNIMSPFERIDELTVSLKEEWGEAQVSKVKDRAYAALRLAMEEI